MRVIEYLLVAIFTLAIHNVLSRDTPEAIDVYRGDTELKIEYRIVNNDTTSVDSTVVFK